MSLSLDNEDLLYRLACECQDLFGQVQEEFLKAQPQGTIVDLCTEFHQTFNIWAAHLGVFARPSQCLDTRLRNFPDLQDLAARLLDILRRSLQQCKIEAIGQGEGDLVLKTALGAIDDALARLNRLGVTIRQSSRSKVETKTKKFAAGLDLRHFDDLCSKAVQNLYPNAHQLLKDYLSKSMTDRYSTLLFLNNRNIKLKARRESPTRLALIPEVPDSESHRENPATQIKKGARLPALRSPQRPLTTPSQSGLSSINIQYIRSRRRPPDEASTKFPKTLSIQVNQGNYPKLPNTSGNQNNPVFSCEWCSEPLNKKSLTEREWRHHIDRDLKPYVCLWQRCTEEHRMYPTKDGWIQHMTLHSHRWHQKTYITPGWICTICESNKEIYDNPQNLYSHLEATHSKDFTIAQLQTISRQSMTERPRAWNNCLLCCFMVENEQEEGEAVLAKRRRGLTNQTPIKGARIGPEMINPGPHNPESNSSDSSSESDGMGCRQGRRHPAPDRSKSIAGHIATHLQVLMLLTLRFATLQNYDGDYDEDLKSNSVDIDEVNTRADGNDLGRLSDIVSRSDVTMKETDDAGPFDIAADLDHITIDDDKPVPDSDIDLSNIPRRYDDLTAENDAVLKKLAESRSQLIRQNPSRSEGWTLQEDQLLLNAYIKGLSWDQIQANYFPSKTPNACRERHQRVMEPKRSGDWDHPMRLDEPEPDPVVARDTDGPATGPPVINIDFAPMDQEHHPARTLMDYDFLTPPKNQLDSAFERQKGSEASGFITTGDTNEEEPEHQNKQDSKVPKPVATFQCTLCPKRFTRAYNLRSHLRRHTDERTFVCKGDLKDGSQWGCGRRFARADALGRHFRSEAGRVCIKPLLDEEIMERQRLWQQQTLQQNMAAPGAVAMGAAPTNLVHESGDYILPAALLAQYPSLAQIECFVSASNAGVAYEGDIEGTSSADESGSSSAGESGYLDHDDRDYVTESGEGSTDGLRH